MFRECMFGINGTVSMPLHCKSANRISSAAYIAAGFLVIVILDFTLKQYSNLQVLQHCSKPAARAD